MKNTQIQFSTVNFNVKALKNGAEKGYCRICGKYGTLTDDHVPPKSLCKSIYKVSYLQKMQLLCGIFWYFYIRILKN